MQFISVSQFEGMPLGTKLHGAIDSHHKPYIFAGIHPKIANAVMLIKGGDLSQIVTYKFRITDPENTGNDYLTDSYEECKKAMVKQAEDRTETILEVYFKDDKNRVYGGD